MPELKAPAKEDFYTECHIGHTKHDRIVVDAQGLGFFVYDYKKYLGKSPDYCTGQDIISEELGERGVWEPCETQLVLDILAQKSGSNQVLDFGSHIGYYTMLAANAGYDVSAFDASAENLEVLNLTALLNKLDGQIQSALCWLDKDVPQLEFDSVHLLKADVEGAEQYVYKMCQDMFEKRKVTYAIFEISPVFNDSYPDLVEDIIACGYKAYIIPHAGDASLEYVMANCDLPHTNRREWVAGLHQENLLFVRAA